MAEEHSTFSKDDIDVLPNLVHQTIRISYLPILEDMPIHFLSRNDVYTRIPKQILVDMHC